VQSEIFERNWLNPQPAGDLAEALTAFNNSNSAVQLQQAYISLRVKFAALNRKLEETNRELNRKVENLSEVKEYLNSILQGITNGVIAQDIDGSITAFNTAAERISGLDSKKVIGKKFSEVFDTAFAGNLPTMPESASQSERYVSCEMKVKGNAPFPVRESTSLTRDSRGRVTGAVKIFEDLTELRELEEQARRQDRLAALGQMSATVAHEIRSPLGGIEGFASLLARDFEADDPRLELVAKIQEGAHSLNRVVAEMLAFVRPVKLCQQCIDVRELVNDALGFLSEGMKKANVILSTRLGPKTSLWGDYEQLKRVILNIALNAVQAMPQGGRMDVNCRKQGLPCGAQRKSCSPRNCSYVDIAIKDTGPGINENDIPFIFNPFFTKKEKGTGLGLAVALKIVEAHGGRILASNASEGGAEFTVSLPAAT
jgi:PAS domain S-box-containing protein